MASLRHAEFIEKMARYTAANKGVAYRKRHANDPQIPSLGDETHKCVCKLAELVDLSTQQTMREGLCAKFKAFPPTSAKLNWLHHDGTIRKSTLEKVMKASGLLYFELDNRLYIHWNEKP